MDTRDRMNQYKENKSLELVEKENNMCRYFPTQSDKQKIDTQSRVFIERIKINSDRKKQYPFVRIEQKTISF